MEILVFFVNSGSSTAPAFSLSASSLPLGLSDVGSSSVPTFVDIDGDGDFDAFVGELFGRSNFFINLGSPSAANFYLTTSSSSPFGLNDVGSHSILNFVDIDGDGDSDVFIGERLGNINFFQNTGSSSEPAFSLSEPPLSFGLSDVGTNATPTFVDIDGDGDSDLFSGSQGGAFVFFENTGSSAAPAFTQSTSLAPFGLSNVGSYSTPNFVDIDGDGDFDVFVGASYFDIGITQFIGVMSFFENTGSSASPAFSLSPSSVLSTTGDRFTPTFVDIDDDGDFDAFVGKKNGQISFFENIGSSATPSFSPASAFGITNIGGFSNPTFVDLDRDGDFDAFIGITSSKIRFFKNLGSPLVPAFGLSFSTAPFGMSAQGYKNAPTFVDIDSDGDFDAFIGEAGGNIIFFENRPCPDAIEINHVLLHQDQFVSEERITSTALIRSGRSVHFSGEQGLEVNAGFEIKNNGAMEVDTKGCKE